MGTPHSAVITFIVTAGVINVIMGIYVLLNRAKQPMSRSFIALCFLSAVYIFGSALELSADSLAEIMFWVKIEYLGMPYLPPLSLLLIMYFLGMDRLLKRWLIAALFVMPAITTVLVMTNEWHHSYYRSVEIRPGASFPTVDLDVGPWYIIQGGFTFGCMIGSVVLLLIYWNRMKSSYRLQYMTMLLGLLLPIIGDFLYLSNLTPEGIDPIPVIMMITSILYMWALASKGMFNVSPIARDYLFESMGDGVLVLDLNNRLVDFNTAAAAVLPELAASSLGHPIEPLWNRHTEEPLPGLPDNEQNETEESEERKDTGEGVKWTIDGQAYFYQIRSSIVRNKGNQEIGKLIVLIDVTERVKLQEQLRILAYHDGLTRIYNRMHFIHKSEALLFQAVASGEKLSIVLFDIDHFKSVNDEYGHDIGDRALLHVVGVCRSLLRPEDVFARYGGEEFVIAMPGLSPAEAEAAAERLRLKIEEQPMGLPRRSQSIAITASFGVAVSSGDLDEISENGIEKLLKAADRALYEAKNSGRNTVRAVAEDSRKFKKVTGTSA
ncbi:histidine kinase N-terminal 7TM domain-containing protein [Paenibacillus sp. NEAU-GSW1]|uniref:histidine kinase N-terminal 7TM domain-containing diguanylate cyclase n=1 Tax=Paenibacillus sp. NEAU-GSW1 TaxID=2682486 RepID=UPI0012E0CC3B|nr:histidine kinase N-terminal 7TM domain-containing protein [Paenibacillus sp. NEAU-GSW1]MUT67149.1 diguanylate cyclase [Paenibacillus sp. NEAU-GSW1]